jgi:hypothetical protein
VKGPFSSYLRRQWRRTPSLAALSRAAFERACESGLPRVAAAIVSQRWEFSTLTASAYLNIPVARLAADHQAATRAIHTRILRELEHLTPGASSPFDRADLLALEGIDGATGRAGSRLYLRTEAVRHGVGALRERVRTLPPPASRSDEARHWNLCTVARWLLLTWATGIRPCRDALVLPRPDGKWLCVADKDSPHAAERRLVPLAPLAERSLAAQRQAAARIRRVLDLRLEVRPEQPYFVIDGSRALGLTPERIRTVLDAHGLAQHWAWPLNAPRHYLTSRAYELRIPLDAIEPFVGHAAGMPPWGRYALAPVEGQAGVFRELAQRVLQEVGFDALAQQ